MPRPLLYLSLLWLSSLSLFASEIDPELRQVLDRYVEAMGGRANLEQIQSVRLQGYFQSADQSRKLITVIKKKPALVRISIESGRRRIVQAYNGEQAWVEVMEGTRSMTFPMEGEQGEIFIREAPLENALITPEIEGLTISLDREEEYLGILCYVIRCVYGDRSVTEFYIDQSTMLERLIVEKNAENEVITTLIPSRYESFGGVLFAMKLVRQVDGLTESTLIIDSVELNIGIMDVIFDPPSTLNKQPEG